MKMMRMFGAENENDENVWSCTRRELGASRPGPSTSCPNTAHSCRHPHHHCHHHRSQSSQLGAAQILPKTVIIIIGSRKIGPWVPTVRFSGRTVGPRGPTFRGLICPKNVVLNIIIVLWGDNDVLRWQWCCCY